MRPGCQRDRVDESQREVRPIVSDVGLESVPTVQIDAGIVQVDRGYGRDRAIDVNARRVWAPWRRHSR
jgi:hypothetical protein